MLTERLAVLVFAAVLAVMTGAVAGAAERRVALVIGNDAYRTVPALQKAVNDARAMAERLRVLGFEVIARENLDRRGTNQALNAFTVRLADAEAGLFFYAGHGVQLDGRNILLPVDIPLPRTPADLVDEGIDLGRVLERIAETRVRFAALIIDACRDNPFPKQGTRSVGGLRGLAVPAAPNGVYIAYSAGVNEQALDGLGPGDRDPNSVFVRNLLPLMGQPGLSFDDMVKQARDRVRQQAASIGHQQNPAIYDQTSGDFYFLGPTTVTIMPPAGQPAAPSVDKEFAFWEAIKDSDDAAAFAAYLRQYPQGAFAELARYRIGLLSRLPAAPTAAVHPAPGGAALPPAGSAAAPSAFDRNAVLSAIEGYYKSQKIYEQGRLARQITYVNALDVIAQDDQTIEVRLKYDAEPLFLDRRRPYDILRGDRVFRLRRDAAGYTVVDMR